MANTIKVTVDTTQAQRSIESLQKSIGGLKTALAGVVTLAAVRGLMQYADTIDDISKANEVAISTVIGFGRALQANGGTAESAGTALATFNKVIAEAAEGSAAAQGALQDVGVSLEDLRTLSIEELFTKSIQGFSGISDASQRAKLSAELFGRALKGVDVRGVGNDLGAFTNAARGIEPSVRAAAKAQENFEQAFRDFSLTALQALKPLSEFAVWLTSNKEAIATFTKSILALAAAYIALGPGIRLATTLTAAWGAALAGTGGVMAAFSKLLMGVVAGFVAFGKNILRAIGLLPTLYGGVASVGFAIGALIKTMLRFAGVVGIIYSVGEALNFLIKQITGIDVLDKVGNFFGDLYDKAKAYFGLGTENKPAEAIQAVTDKAEENRRVINKAANEIKAANEKIIATYRGQIQERDKQFQQELALISLSEEQRQSVQRLNEIESAYLTQVSALQERYNELKQAAAEGTKEDQARFNEFARTQAATLAAVTAEYERQRLSVEQYNQAIAQATAAEKLRQFQQQQQLDMSKKLRDLDGEYAKMGLGELQRAYYDVAEASMASARAAIEAEKARRGAALTKDEEQAYIDTAIKGLDEIWARLQRNYEASRSFQAGWSEAYRQFADDATNAANAARQIFGTMTRGIEDAIVGLVTKGKFNFRDLANSIISDLIRIQVRKALVGAFNMGGGGGGGGGDFLSTAISWGSKLLGFANGGSPPVGRASIVGENGPELFVPRQPGTVVPNSQMGMQPSVVNNYYYNNNITAMDAKSVAQVFAENRTALFGQVEMARREMPVRTR